MGAKPVKETLWGDNEKDSKRVNWRKSSEMNRKRDVRVTSCSLWICPRTLYLDTRDPDAMTSLKSKTGLGGIDNSPSDGWKSPYSLWVFCTQKKTS